MLSGALVLVLSFGAAILIGMRAPVMLRGGEVFASGEVVPLLAMVVVAPQIAVFVAIATVFLAPATSASVRLLAGSQVLAGVGVATIVASVLGLPHTSLTGFLIGSLVCGIAFMSTNACFVIAYERVVWNSPLGTLVPVAVGTVVATVLFAMPFIALTGAAIHAVGAVAVPLVLVPLTISQYFHGLYQRRQQLTDELADKNQILAKTNLQFAAAMIRALDARDAYTAGHSAAVAVYTRDIAREMGFDDETVRKAHLAGLLHDIGKIGVPGRVLNKTAPLDDEEYELMKGHAAAGADILGEVDLYEEVAGLVRHHHERIDGKGYPDGIGGEFIPAISRIISVADTYSAMTTDRPYRDGMPTEKAMSILRECRGTQLDQDFTDAFLRILIVADEGYQRGKQTDFEVEVAKHQALSEVEAEAVRVSAPTPASPVIPAATPDGDVVEVELEREAA